MGTSTLETLRRGHPKGATSLNLLLNEWYPTHDYAAINRHPDFLWRLLEAEDALLGQVAGTEGAPWHAFYPGIHYVNGHPESRHIVISARRNRFITPGELPVSDTEKAAVFVNKFLDSGTGQAYAGYNIGPEPNSSQAWWNWHIHLVRFGEKELKGISTRPRIIWEPWPAHIEQVMGDVFVNRLQATEGVPHAEAVPLSTLDRFGFSSFGSVLLRFEPNISARELATVMKQTDSAYKGLHSDLKNIFFKPEEGEHTFTRRAPEEMRTHLTDYARKHNLQDQTTENLVAFGETGIPERLPDESIRSLPNYSVSLLKDEHGMYLLFQPHLRRAKASALSSLGILLDRKFDVDPRRVAEYRRKKELYRGVVQQINDSLQPQPSVQ